MQQVCLSVAKEDLVLSGWRLETQARQRKTNLIVLLRILANCVQRLLLFDI